MEKLLMKKIRLKSGKMEKSSKSFMESVADKCENDILALTFPDIRK